MIKVDGNKVEIEGTSNTIVNEVSGVLNSVCKNLGGKHEGLSYETVLQDILDTANVHKLVDSGMTGEEAIKVLGLEDKVSTSPDLDEAVAKAKEVMAKMAKKINKKEV